MSEWIGVDLDGTLAYYEGWAGVEKIGAPIPLMVQRVRMMRAAGTEVRIFTARVAHPTHASEAVDAIRAWCVTHLGEELPITCSKDLGMIALYDDRAIRVEHNTGVVLFPPEVV